MSVWPLVPLPLVALVVGLAAYAGRDRRGVGLSLVPLVAGGLLILAAGMKIRIEPPELVGVDGFVFVVDGALMWWLLADARSGRATQVRAARVRREFDKQLHREIERYNDIIRAQPPTVASASVHNEWRAAVATAGDQTLRRIGRLRAPDSDWSDVRDEYVALVRGQLAALATPPTPGRAEQLAELNLRISDRVLALRRGYEASAPDRATTP